MTTQSDVFAATKSSLKSGKRPPPLNQDDLEPLLSASLKIQFSPAMMSPHVKFPRTPPPAAKSPSGVYSPLTSNGRKGRSQNPSSLGDNYVIQYAFETSKLPADVPTATFDGPLPLPSKFSSSESNSSSWSSDSDDSLSDPKPRRRSVRFSLPTPQSPIPRARTQEEIDRALSFLPHPGSPFVRSPNPKLPRIKTGLNGSGINQSRKVGHNPPKAKAVRRPAELLVPDMNDLRFAPPGLMGRKKLTPVEESPLSSPSVATEGASSDENTDSTTSTLSRAFWGSVTVQRSPSDEEPSSPSPQSMPTDALQACLKLVSPTVPKPALLSPQPPSAFMHGDSTTDRLWDPRVPRVRTRAASPLDFSQFPYSPATTATAAQTFQTMTSPAPKDPVFPTLASAAEVIESGVKM
jgi:hypothetical protein